MASLRVSFLALLSCLLLSGCVNNRYVAPVNTFHTSANQTIATISDFYASRNAYETQLYLDSVAFDGTRRVGKIDENGAATPLGKPTFSPASLKARLDALSLVSAYASRLYEIANTAAPNDLAANVDTLGSNLKKLNTTFMELTNDNTANKYVDPVATLIGTIGKMYLQGKRDALLHDAINAGSPQVKIILTQIKSDMDDIFSAQVITGADQEVALEITLYNNRVADSHRHPNDPRYRAFPYEERVASLTKLRAAVDAASSATASGPARLVSSMLEANEGLVDAANAPKKEKQAKLTQLNVFLAAWAAEIETLSKQIKPLIK